MNGMPWQQDLLLQNQNPGCDNEYIIEYCLNSKGY